MKLCISHDISNCLRQGNNESVNKRNVVRNLLNAAEKYLWNNICLQAMYHVRSGNWTNAA